MVRLGMRVLVVAGSLACAGAASAETIFEPPLKRHTYERLVTTGNYGPAMPPPRAAPATVTAPVPAIESPRELHTGSLPARAEDATDDPVPEYTRRVRPESIVTSSVPVEEAGEEPDDALKDTWSFETSIALSAGHDSNLDAEEGGEATSFYRTDTGAELGFATDSTDLRLRFSSIYIDAIDLRQRNRWRYQADAELRQEISEDIDVVIDYQREHDAITTPATITNEGGIAVEVTRNAYTLTLRGSIANEENLSVDTDFGSEPADSFNFIKSGGRLRLVANPTGLIAPFVEGRAYYVEFPEEDKSVINRNAMDYSLIAGAVFTFSEQLQFSLGGRFNQRLFDNLNPPELSNAFVDAALTWTPSDRLSVASRIVRQIGEPSIEGAIAEQETNYMLEATWRPVEALRIDGAVEYSVTDEFDENNVTKELFVKGRLTYSIAENLAVFAAMSYTTSKSEVDGIPDERFDRIVASSGFEANF